MILVSACLLGHKVKYDGGENAQPLLLRYAVRGQFLPVCPECAANLPVPRHPMEIQGGAGAEVWAGCAVVRDVEGVERTEAFRRGAARVCALAEKYQARVAILKENSPSCGVHQVYDGLFRRRTIQGQGVAAARLAAAGLRLYSEKELTEALLTALLAADQGAQARQVSWVAGDRGEGEGDGAGIGHGGDRAAWP